MAQPVPTAAALADIYPPSALPAQHARWSALSASFSAAFSHSPAFIARSPGRVNLIGEHIDYSLYSVLPTAITLDVLVAVSSAPPTARDGSFTIALHNTDPAFGPRSVTAVNGDVPIDAAQPDWSNYVKAGIRGALQLLSSTAAATAPRDLCLLVDGTVPAGGGLSSSAALVTASALAVLHALAPAHPVDKTALTELAITSERAVGVHSGGMDQAASVFSQRASVLHVRFAPRLTATAVPMRLPQLAVVIVNSRVTSAKRVTAPRCYNLRVVECTLAAAVLHAALNPPGARLPSDASPLHTSLHGFHERYADSHAAFAALDELAQLRALADLTERTLTQAEGYTRAEISTLLGMSPAELEAAFLAQFPVDAERFRLRQRAVHVFSEAARVLEFVALLRGATAAAAAADDESLPQQLGDLMDASQTSCRELYECSHEALDRICAIARRNGACGSRLTGAGWGGCSVHLVPVDRVDSVTEALKTEYFAGVAAEDVDRAIIVTKPACGSALYEMASGVV